MSSRDRVDDEPESQAWLEYYLPTWAESELGTFQFARASPHILDDTNGEITGEALVQVRTFSAENSSYPATEVSRWAADNPRPDAPRAHGESSLYRPLEDNHDIRVLEVLPATTPDEPLRARLHHCSIGLDMDHAMTAPSAGRFALDVRNLEHPIWYTALSYTWGPPVFEATIHCDGHTKAITRTLETALKHFRHRTDSIVLWVDQVCINQDDLEEKKQQIPLMSRIYTRAFNTLIWLGEESTDGSSGTLASTLDFLNDITIRLQFANEVACPEGLEDVQLPPGDSHLWKDLMAFFSRPWFQRLWIIQEVILSRNAWVMCGRYILPWRRVSTPCVNMKLSGISDWLSTRAETMRKRDTAVPATDGWDACEQLGRGVEGVTLFSLIRDYRHALCWDPRDKVYGMLAITMPGEAGAVNVDYTSAYSFANLYHDIAKTKIRDMLKVMELSSDDDDDGKTLELLSVHRILVQVDGPDRLSDGLPSWVPDWSTGRRTNPMAGTLNAHVFHASGGIGHNYSLDDSNDAILQVGAGFVDRIVDMTDIFDAPSLSYEDIPNGNADLLSCFKLCSSLPETYAAPSQTVFDAFWHSMVAGMSETGREEAPAAFAEIFSVLLDASTGLEPSLPGQSYSPRQRRPVGKGKLTPNQLGSRTAGATFRNARAAMRNAMRNRRLGITEKGYIGLFPSHTIKGDVINVLGGCPVPYVMREVKGKSCWHIIGECYVHGIMQGEMAQEEGFEWNSIMVE